MPKLILENVRGSYVYADKPRKKADGTPSNYGIQIIVPKDHPQIKAIKKAILVALEEKHGSEATSKKARYKLPLRDGDEERDGEEYANCYFLNANGKKRPGIVNKQGQTADADDIEEYCYSGAYFNVSVSFYGFPAKDGGKPGVAVGFNNLMLLRKGDRLDGTVAATSEFASFVNDDDDDEDDDDNW